MKKNLLYYVSCICACLFLHKSVLAQSDWVAIGSNGDLTYTADALGNRIMDFSYAGYKGGGVALPTTIPGNVVTVAAGSGDRTADIQAAINAVGNQPLTGGFRGVVQLAAGTFNISAPLTITKSGVVLRGSGSGSSGTILRMASGMTSSSAQCIRITGTGGYTLSNTVNMVGYDKTAGGSSFKFVPSGTNKFKVSSLSGFGVGNTILITREVTNAWVQAIGMDDVYDGGVREIYLEPGDEFVTDRVITAINTSTNEITVDAPLTDCFDSRWMEGKALATVSKYTFSGRISEVGVENLRIVANSGTTSTYKALYMNQVINGWIKNVNSFECEDAYDIDRLCKNITLEKVINTISVPQTDGARKTHFKLLGTQTLLNNCETHGTGNWTATTGAQGVGPIVVLNLNSTENSGVAPHMKWTTGVLADNCTIPNAPEKTPGIAFTNREELGTAHGWTTAWSVGWNMKTPYVLVQAPDAPSLYKNWAIGGTGQPTADARGPESVFDHVGTTVSPTSLFLAQLKERFDKANGTGVQALHNIGYADVNLTPYDPSTGGIPAAPSNLAATANSSTQINLTWTDNSTNEDKFYIQSSTDGVNFTGVTNPPANATSYAVTGLLAGTQYWFRVRSENADGKSAYSNVATATTSSSIPAPPSNAVATANSSTQITVSWNDNSTNEDVFYLQQSTDGVNFTGVTNPPANATSYAVTGLTADTQYWFRVRSENASGKSAYSNVATATTPPAITYYRIKVVNNPTYVLNAASTSLTNGTNVNVYTSGTSNAQQWQLIDTDNGYKRIASKINSNFVLDCSTTPANGVNVQLWNWTGNDRQQWLLTDIGGGAYKITVRADPLQGLDCSAVPVNGTNVQMWNYVGNNRQQWILEPVTGGGAFVAEQVSLKPDSESKVSQLSVQYLSSNGYGNGLIKYSLPADAVTSLELYNLNGQKVAELFKGLGTAGEHQVTLDNIYLMPGMYVIRLVSGSDSKTTKMIK